MRPLYESVDSGARKRTRVIADSDTGLPLIVTEQDVRPILEANRRLQAQFDKAQTRRSRGRWRRVAELPMVVVLQLNQLGIMRGFHVLDERAFRRVLSDPDNRHLRTDDGRRLA